VEKSYIWYQVVISVSVSVFVFHSYIFLGGGGIKKGALFPDLKKPMKVYVFTYDLHRFTATVPIG
jgi:hypothetical protein